MADTSTRQDVLRPMLLAPKFLPPQARQGLVRRDRLHQCLSRASSAQVTLVSAPAGSGKTALVAAWLSEVPSDRWAWLALDERDNDLVRVWAHLIEALSRLAGGAGEQALLELMRSGGQSPVDRWLGLLVNDLVAVERPVSYLVIDDLHVLTDPAIRGSVSLFAASMPSWLRLVILTRADPPLPLARLRAEGRLNEIRQQDLRFDKVEAEALLRTQGIDDLAGEQLQWLMERTEGWAAGLQLAVIVLARDAGPARLELIAGSNRTFADYIVSEVVDVVPDDLRRFLFATSVLDRVSPALARAVSGSDDAGQLLRAAHRQGLFVVALDDQGEWFRYHPLFAEAVQAEARSSSPDLVRLAHERAATWFESTDDLSSALDHWLAAGRPDEALRVVRPLYPQLLDTGQLGTIERIASLIPHSAVGDDASRQLDYALLHHTVDADTMRYWADKAEATIAALDLPAAQLIRDLQSNRAVHHMLLGEWDDAAECAAASIDPRGMGEGDTEFARRTGLHLLRAEACREECDRAEKIFHAYLHHGNALEERTFIATCSWAMGAALGGRMYEAATWTSRSVSRTDERPVSPNAYLYLLLARAFIGRELVDAESARRAIEEMRRVHMPTAIGLRVTGEVEMSVVLIGEGRLAEAAALLTEVDLVRAECRVGPRVHDAVDRAWTDLRLAERDLVRARTTAQRMRIGFWREATRAKVLLAGGEHEHAAELLAAVEPTSPRQAVTAGILHAAALAGHDQEASTARATEAFVTAATEGMFQTVVAADPGVSRFVETAGWAVPEDWLATIRRLMAKGPAGTATGPVPALYEQPTERERTVARYLASRLTVPEIAREMGISPNTLKTHVSSLYRKLDVTSRDAAVAKARRVGIIG